MKKSKKYAGHYAKKNDESRFIDEKDSEWLTRVFREVYNRLGKKYSLGQIRDVYYSIFMAINLLTDREREWVNIKFGPFGNLLRNHSNGGKEIKRTKRLLKKRKKNELNGMVFKRPVKVENELFVKEMERHVMANRVNIAWKRRIGNYLKNKQKNELEEES